MALNLDSDIYKKRKSEENTEGEEQKCKKCKCVKDEIKEENFVEETIKEGDIIKEEIRGIIPKSKSLYYQSKEYIRKFINF